MKWAYRQIEGDLILNMLNTHMHHYCLFNRGRFDFGQVTHTHVLLLSTRDSIVAV